MTLKHFSNEEYYPFLTTMKIGCGLTLLGALFVALATWLGLTFYETYANIANFLFFSGLVILFIGVVIVVIIVVYSKIKIMKSAESPKSSFSNLDENSST